MQPDQVTEGEYRVFTHPRPTAAINASEFHAQTMTAFWPGPEPASLDGALAAVDSERKLASLSLAGRWIIVAKTDGRIGICIGISAGLLQCIPNLQSEVVYTVR
jgi:hypothetical protein